MSSIVYDIWLSVPPVTRTVLLIMLSLSSFVALDLCTEQKLLFSYPLIRYKGEYWRMLTCLFYKGELSAHTIYNMLMFYYQCSRMEEGDFVGKPADLVMLFLFLGL